MSTRFPIVRRGFPAASVCAVATGLLLGGTAQAQSIERHLPPASPGTSSSIVAPNAVPDNQDATPIGPALKTIVLLGTDDTVKTGGSAGAVDISPATRLDRFAAATRADLAPFIGQPLSHKLIAQVEARVARRYRAIGYPFVSLVTPAQDISDGILQVRIIEFTAGDVSTHGVPAAVSANLIKRVSLKPGDAIDTNALGEDLDWINRYPYRQAQAVFKPGQGRATSDLILAVDSAKPWQAYAGYANDGSPATGEDRYFLGGALGNVFGADSVLSAQTTASRDAVSGHRHPAYSSQALTYTLPLGLHGQIEASADRVETNQSSDPFVIRLNVDEGFIDYRVGLPSTAVTHTDMAFGLSAKHQDGTTLFGDLKAYEAVVEDYQVFVNLHRRHDGAHLLSSWDVTLHLSPGDVDRGNSPAQTELYSQGRLKNATYAYLNLSYKALAPLPGDYTVGSMMYLQAAGKPLPRTEQSGLGGADLVRGYTLDDGAYDASFVLRNELRTPIVHLANGNQSLSPYLFVDVGAGRDQFLKTGRTLASAGLGADVTVTRAVTLHLDAADALRRSYIVRPGDWKLEASLKVSL